jgi:hypothetical protein
MLWSVLFSHPSLCHDVGAVHEVGDSPETLSLALGTEVAARFVETLQQGVVLHIQKWEVLCCVPRVLHVQDDSSKHTYNESRQQKKG